MNRFNRWRVSSCVVDAMVRHINATARKFGTWRQAADHLGMNPGSLYRIATGQWVPHANTARAWLREWGVEPEPTHRTIAFRLPIDEADAFDAWCQQFGDTRREQARRMTGINGNLADNH